MEKLTPEEVKLKWKAAGDRALNAGIEAHIAVDTFIKTGIVKCIKYKDLIKRISTAIKTELAK